MWVFRKGDLSLRQFERGNMQHLNAVKTQKGHLTLSRVILAYSYRMRSVNVVVDHLSVPALTV